MIRRLISLLILCLLAALPARGEEVVAGLSQTDVAITTTFKGSEILIFGAVKRDKPAPEDKLDVIITVSSHLTPVLVRKKERKLGIWVNAESAEIDFAPTFYAIRSTAPLNEILSPAADLQHSISVPRAIRAHDAQPSGGTRDPFVEAVIRIRTDQGAYQVQEESIELTEDTLFRANVELPSNLTEGDYRTRIFLLRNNQVIDAYETTLDVRKVGLERWIYNLAHEHSLIYGLLSLIIAIAAGWGASAFFRLLKN
ncbi:TIGR02186 family protein [Actibacterium pelagium]|uniref:Membrane protein n=1 Tax=Actibacterium pelagium TaxID=2029103 RepID=A0A917AAG8_9RHOB|nr:TIGR02186 family protein [Actibacterium pelagium]GGE37467.1 membrane protein [Actibacterium pelagium]